VSEWVEFNASPDTVEVTSEEGSDSQELEIGRRKWKAALSKL